ncbi:MAG: hypothetical protein ACKO0M_03575 [Cyanobium sp.]
MILLLPGPASAATQVDIDTLVEVIRSAGSEVVERKDCGKNLLGYYQYEEKKVDQIVLCTNNIDVNDTDQVWEVLAHETTHIMQACDSLDGGMAFEESFFPRIYREVQELSPSSIDDTAAHYGTWNKRQEIEARYMELLPAKDVIELFQSSLCFKQTQQP